MDPVRYFGAVTDPDTGELISDASGRRTSYTAFTSTKSPVTARLIVRRVRHRKTTTSCIRCGDRPSYRPAGRCHSEAA